MNSDSTFIGHVATSAAAAASARTGAPPQVAAVPVVVVRSDTAARVAAVITRRARVAGLTDADYFAEIMAGRAPRITRAEAASEVLPTNPPRRGARGDGAKVAADDTATLH